MRRLATLAIAAGAIAALTACGYHSDIRPDAFDRGQRAALVLLHTEGKISPEPADSFVPGTSIVRSPGGKEIDARPVFEAIRPVIVEAMARNPHFRLVPEAKVFATPGYASLPDTEPRWGYIVPKGYKVAPDSAYPPILKELGAGMGVGILLNLFYDRRDGAAKMIVYVGIFDGDGQQVWKGGSKAEADVRVNVLAASEAERIETFKAVARKAMAAVEQAMTDELQAARAPAGGGR
jgi:hypothetical protein